MPQLPGFPEVHVDVGEGFATSVGAFKEVRSISVHGLPCERGDVLEKVVGMRGNAWTAMGGSSDADIEDVFGRYLAGWAELLEEDQLTDREAPDDLRALLERKGETLPAYHPRRISFHELPSGRVVVGSWWERQHVGEFGREWRYAVVVHRAAFGTRVTVSPEEAAAATPPIPEPGHYMELEP